MEMAIFNQDRLLIEARTIQSTLLTSKKFRTPEQTAKSFAKLMMEGKVNAALRVLDEEQSGGVLPLSEAVLKDLQNKHPLSEPPNPTVMIDGEIPLVDPTLFSNIDESSIAKAAMNTKGAAGPSGLDALAWRHILVSKNYRSSGKDLRDAVAMMARHLATRKNTIIDGKSNLEAYLSCRLIPSDKQPGVRPIGIGETLRRIIGKTIIATIKPKIMESAGSLQLCAGQKAGCEAAVHAMTMIFAEDQTDALMFVDASNAFNSINRKVMLHNIQYICPSMYIYSYNSYSVTSRLFVQGGKEIISSEGTTQGDPLAMPMYAVSITPLLNKIKNGDTNNIKHAAFADDISGAGKIDELRKWWENITTHGPLLGYYPNPDKSWLVVKQELFDKATEKFNDTGVNITTEGRKYLGGFIGTNQGKEKHVNNLIEKWSKQLIKLSSIAKFEPQAAYTAFVSGFRHRFTYHIRTIPDLSAQLQNVDHIIDHHFIPAITDGRKLSCIERKLFALPVRLGGLGIPILSEMCDYEHQNSKRICESISNNIITQNNINSSTAENNININIRSQIIKTRNDRQKIQLEQIRLDLNANEIRANDLAQLKGSSNWLTALPIQQETYVLSKREFFDAISLRYRWNIKYLPAACACGKTFTIDHAISCIKGGFIHRRHNEIRDLFAKLFDEVCHDVSIEPTLVPLTGEVLPAGSNKADEARLDIAARGFWGRCEKAFFDVRIFNPYAKTHLNQSLDNVFNSNEREKKRHYNQRVIQIEHASFTPLVFSAYGGCSRETKQAIATLADRLAEKKDTKISTVTNWIRTKISFALLRSSLLCIRGSRAVYQKPDFNTEDIILSENNSRL